MSTDSRIISVGHSNHSPEFFLNLLRRAEIAVIADVRSSPYSRRLPHFNRPELEPMLLQKEIGYLFLGEWLGGRPADEDVYDADGRVDYERVRHTDFFRRGLERLLQEAEDSVVAMMCSEEDPLDCHRGLMIAPALGERGKPPTHLRKDGRLETQHEMEVRLLSETRVGEAERGGLFPVSDQDYRALVGEAYRVMARKKAFQVRRDVDSG